MITIANCHCATFAGCAIFCDANRSKDSRNAWPVHCRALLRWIVVDVWHPEYGFVHCLRRFLEDSVGLPTNLQVNRWNVNFHLVVSCMLHCRLSHFSEKTVSSILKAVVLLMGCAVLGLVFVIEHLSTIFELTVAILAVTGGALLGLFTVGMLCRRVNTKGAICGMIPSLLLLLFIVIGSQSAPQKPTLPMRTDGCSEIQSDWYDLMKSAAPTRSKYNFSRLYLGMRLRSTYQDDHKHSQRTARTKYSGCSK